MRSPIHVLIVAGSPEHRQSLRRLLDESALAIATTREADSAEQALASCRRSMPDCVLLADQLPDQDGRAALRALGALGVAPIVLLTSAGDEPGAAAALEDGGHLRLDWAALSAAQLGLALRAGLAMAGLARERDAARRMLAATLDAVPHGVAVLDGELRISHANAGFAALLAQPGPVEHGAALADRWPALAEQLAPLAAHVLAEARAVGPIQIVAPRPGAATGRRSWELSLRPLALPDGGPGLCLAIQDVAAQPAGHRARPADEHWLRLAISGAQMNAWEWDLESGLVTFMAREGNSFDLEGGPQTLPFATMQETVYPPDRPAYEEAVWRAIRRPEPYQIRVRARTGTGELRYLELHGLPQHDAGGRPVRVFGVTRDITAQKYAEEALQESEARYRTLFETMAQGVIYLDAEGRIVAVNPAAERMVGLSQEQLLGRSSLDSPWGLRHEDGTAFAAEDYPGRASLRTGQEVRAIVASFWHPGLAAERWIRFSSVPQFRPGETRPGQVYTIFEDITEQRRATHALERERQLLAAIVRTQHDGVIAFLPDGTLVLANTAALRLGGLDVDPASLAVAQALAQLQPIDAQGQPLPLEAWPARRVLRGETFANLELRVRHADAGAERWLAFSGTPVYDAQGQLTMGVVTAQEITRRKRDEAALQAAYAQAEALAQTAATQAARLDSLLAHAPIGISLLDTELRFQHINAYLAAINGLPPEAHLGRPIGEVLPALATALQALYGHVLATGEPLLDQEVVGETPAAPGTPRIWRVSYFPVCAPGGPLLGVGAVVIDITAQRQMEQALQAHHQQLETILQTLDTGVMAVQPDGIVALANAATQRHFGIDTPEQLQTQRGIAVLPKVTLSGPDGAVVPRDDWPIVRVLRGERFRNEEFQMYLPGQAEGRWLTLSGAPIYSADGTLVLGVVTADDITQRRRAEEALAAHTEELSKSNAELSRALKLKDEFLAMMSHELRTPLNAVLGVSEAIIEGLYGPITARQQQGLATVLQSGRHLLGILSEILDLAHIEAGHAMLNVQAIDVDVLCRTVLQFVQAPAQAKEIQLLRTVAFGIEGLRADERRLTQILTNLLDNAVKFTPPRGKVGLEVVADSDQEHIAFAVWDTGIGIAAADQERLFQPFMQLDAGLARKYEGIGLGLTLVRRLVELHGGSVALESTPGQGSRFTVRLPWSAGENIAPVVRRAEPPPATWARPPRLVFADDHELFLQIYEELLREQGCQVELARTGVEAVAQVRATRPDVAVLDIQMPELDGLSVIRRIRADPEVGGTPIIALTALAMPGDRERCLEAGANAYLAKPVSLRTLMATIAEVLRDSGAGP